MFHQLNDLPDEQFYIQCWLNFYRKGEFIDWHAHWDPHYKSWHGFYCVSGKGSHTTYKLPPDHKKEVVIPTVMNQIVLSKSDGDIHRSSDWKEDYPRITIAFDIVPGKMISESRWINHWIPI
jgi:predicted RNA binding protein YcfA (HicA-like mRNA interferase family)